MAKKSKFWLLVEHPRTALIVGLVIGGAAGFAPSYWPAFLWLFAVVLIVRSGWEWAPIRNRIPFDFQSPIVRRLSHPPKPLPPELGNLDYELSFNKAAEAVGSNLGKMGKELSKSSARLSKATNRILASAGKSVEARMRVNRRASKVTRNLARRLSRFQRQYSASLATFTEDGKRWIQLTTPDEGIQDFLALMLVFRAAVAENRESNLTYRATAQVNRALQMSQEMNGAFDELIKVVGVLIEDSDHLIAFCDWTIQWAIDNGASP